MISTRASPTPIDSEEHPRIWALLGGRAGDNDQVIALAEALGLPAALKQLEYNRLHALGPRLLRRSLASLTSHSRRAIIDQPLPDLTISTGHRSVPIVRALRARSGGRTRSIHIGFPRVSPAHFDLVITTPQYPVSDHPNVLRIPVALTRAAIACSDRSKRAAPATPAAPRRLLVIGGPTLFWKMDSAAVRRTLAEMLRSAERGGGSVLVITSPRTSQGMRDELASIMRKSPVETVLSEPGGSPSYMSLLATADSIAVTADSVSMISDAIWTGKPVALVPVSPSPGGRLMFALHDRLHPGTRAYPQDLRYFWQALEEMGLDRSPAVPTINRDAIVTEVAERARAILKRHGVLTQ